MSMSAYEYVTVELSLNSCERFEVAPRENLMSMNDSNLKIADLDDFCLWQASPFIKVTFHDVSLTLCCGEVFEPFDGL